MAHGVQEGAREAVTIRAVEHAQGGHLHGLGQPFLQARLAFDLPSAVPWEPIDEALRTAVPYVEDGAPAFADAPLAGAIERILHWSAAFQRAACDAVFEPGRVLWRAGDAAELTVLALPTLDPTIATAALRTVTALINGGVGGGASAEDLMACARVELDRLAQERGRSPVGPAMVLLLAAAHQRRIPWLRLGPTATFQLGHGARSRWLEMSITDSTSLLGAQVAQNKAATASVLRLSGLPVPEHRVVTTEDAAVEAAEALGFPVVVKPLDMDLGIGVQVGLADADAVRRAFTAARQHSARVLVEDFIEGRDHRMVVFKGRLVWAVERTPGGVTGDGVSTVRELVDRLNADPQRSGGVMARMKKLEFDDEAVERLAAIGMDGESVPRQGEPIRLRGAANMARGGVATPVFDKVHPDNRQLAERAAQLLRLDIAGVDLIIPDISRSWKETGAGICEVNARPDLFTTVSDSIYPLIVEGLVQGDGRIPIALIVGAEARATRLVAGILAAAGVRPGVAGPGGVWIGPERIVTTSSDVFTGARLLLVDRGVEAMVVAVGDDSPSRTGMPFDRCHVVALAGSRLEGVAAGGPDGDVEFRRLALSLLPMSGGAVVANAEDPACVALAAEAQGRRLILHAPAPGAEALAEHRRSGGAAVWVEGSAGAPRVVVETGRGAAIEIPLAVGEGDPYAAAEVALAVAVAGAVGCGEAALRQGLAGVRLAG